MALINKNAIFEWKHVGQNVLIIALRTALRHTAGKVGFIHTLFKVCFLSWILFLYHALIFVKDMLCIDVKNLYSGFGRILGFSAYTLLVSIVNFSQ